MRSEPCSDFGYINSSSEKKRRKTNVCVNAKSVISVQIYELKPRWIVKVQKLKRPSQCAARARAHTTKTMANIYNYFLIHFPCPNEMHFTKMTLIFLCRNSLCLSLYFFLLRALVVVDCVHTKKKSEMTKPLNECRFVCPRKHIFGQRCAGAYVTTLF